MKRSEWHHSDNLINPLGAAELRPVFPTRPEIERMYILDGYMAYIHKTLGYLGVTGIDFSFTEKVLASRVRTEFEFKIKYVPGYNPMLEDKMQGTPTYEETFGHEVGFSEHLRNLGRHRQHHGIMIHQIYLRSLFDFESRCRMYRDKNSLVFKADRWPNSDLLSPLSVIEALPNQGGHPFACKFDEHDQAISKWANRSFVAINKLWEDRTEYLDAD